MDDQSEVTDLQYTLSAFDLRGRRATSIETREKDACTVMFLSNDRDSLQMEGMALLIEILDHPVPFFPHLSGGA